MLSNRCWKLFAVLYLCCCFPVCGAVFWNWVLTNPHSTAADSVVLPTKPASDEVTTSLHPSQQRLNATEVERYASHPKNLPALQAALPTSSYPREDMKDLEKTLREPACTSDLSCEKTKFCDIHYGTCALLRKPDEPCRADRQCQGDFDCMFGRCMPRVQAGHEGARCVSESDCLPGLCCARQHGERVCKRKLRQGQNCYVPDGGLAYSLNELCPCDEGLLCSAVTLQTRGYACQVNRPLLNSSIYLYP